MALFSIFYIVLILWTGGLPDWIVAYATGLAQLAIWVTLLSFLPFSTLWLSLRTSFFAEIPRPATGHVHWALSTKI